MGVCFGRTALGSWGYKRREARFSNRGVFPDLCVVPDRAARMTRSLVPLPNHLTMKKHLNLALALMLGIAGGLLSRSLRHRVRLPKIHRLR